MQKNQKVNIQGNNIISLQNKSTPGIYKNFNVQKHQNYTIRLINFKSNHPTILWISSKNSKLNKMKSIKNNTTEFIHYNDIYDKLKIGVLFKSPKINNSFTLNDIIIEPIQQKISIVIPCLYIHFHFIENLLQLYSQQSLIPTEIIIVVAEADKLDNTLLTEIGTYPFNINIIKIEEKSLSGNSRYIGAKNTSPDSDIIIFQDADDIPHQQRIEIMAYYFRKYPKVMHICHKWSKDSSNFSKLSFNINEVKYVIPTFNMFSNKKYRQIEHVANGNIGIRRNIYDNIKWYKNQVRKQDIATNINIADKYKSTLFIREELYLYRCENSSYEYTSQYSESKK